MLILPLYPTGRRWPEVAPIAPLWVTESILSSDTDGLSVVLDFKLTNVCRVDGQVLRSRNKSHHSSNATFMLSCDIFVIVLLWTVFTLISHKYFIVSLTFLYYLHFTLILFFNKSNITISRFLLPLRLSRQCMGYHTFCIPPWAVQSGKWGGSRRRDCSRSSGNSTLSS